MCVVFGVSGAHMCDGWECCYAGNKVFPESATLSWRALVSWGKIEPRDHGEVVGWRGAFQLA